MHWPSPSELTPRKYGKIGFSSSNRKIPFFAKTPYYLSAYSDSKTERWDSNDKKYKIDQLQQHVKDIFPKYVETPDSSFRRLSDDGNYLFDYIDRDNMIRIRNFFVDEGMHPSEDGKKLVGLKYNVIEITNYIDENIMPE